VAFKLSPTMQLALAGGGGLAVGAFLMGLAAQKSQQQILAQQAAIAAIPNPTPIPELVSSTQSLNNGWMYFVTVAAPGQDVTQLATQQTIAAALLAAGFVDPTTKAAPTVTPIAGDTTRAQAITVFNGATGTSVPASTATLQWASVLGLPAPEGLATV
jgi:hypothetical protein